MARGAACVWVEAVPAKRRRGLCRACLARALRAAFIFHLRSCHCVLCPWVINAQACFLPVISPALLLVALRLCSSCSPGLRRRLQPAAAYHGHTTSSPAFPSLAGRYWGRHAALLPFCGCCAAAASGRVPQTMRGCSVRGPSSPGARRAMAALPRVPLARCRATAPAQAARKQPWPSFSAVHLRVFVSWRLVIAPACYCALFALIVGLTQPHVV